MVGLDMILSLFVLTCSSSILRSTLQPVSDVIQRWCASTADVETRLCFVIDMVIGGVCDCGGGRSEHTLLLPCVVLYVKLMVGERDEI